MKKLMRMKSALLIIVIWIALYVINTNVDLVPLLSGRGFNKLAGEYYRIISGAMLHVDLLHLLANCLALYWMGYYLEPNIGSGKFLLFALVSCIVAETIFLSIYRDADASLGGSAITFALIGLIIILQFFQPSFPRFKLGTWYGNWILLYGILSNVPFLPFMNVTTVVLHGVSLGAGALLAIPFQYVLLRL